jgi:hypothetical protein
MEHILEIDQQEIPLDAETAASDDEIRLALRGCYPEIANATISRRTEGERKFITVIKRAGTKGRERVVTSSLEEVLAELRAAPETVPAAVSLAAALQAQMAMETLSLGGLALRRGEMAAAIAAGEDEIAQVRQAGARLRQALPQAAATAPVGF